MRGSTTPARIPQTRSSCLLATSEDGGGKGDDVGPEKGGHNGEASANDADAGFDGGPDADVDVGPWDDESDVSKLDLGVI